VTAPKTVSYGSWKSPISSSMVASGGITFDRPIVLDRDDIYWVESRPAEGGRSVVVRWSPQEGTADVTPASFNARTRVHEYGGGAFTVESGTVFFSNFVDQGLYRQEPDTEPEVMTPPTASATRTQLLTGIADVSSACAKTIRTPDTRPSIAW